MSAGRILLLLIVVGVVAWLVRSSPLLKPGTPDGSTASPTERARAAARVSTSRNAQTEAAAKDLEGSGSGGSVTENMTTEQVRALLGQPESVETETTDSGATREKWSYHRVGKTVVFENGIVVRIE